MIHLPIYPIELRHLRYFVAAPERGRFRKAGAAIGVRRSAFGRRIRDLEHHLGTALFHRHAASDRAVLHQAAELLGRRVRPLMN